MPARQDLLLGQLAIQRGYLTEDELADCVHEQEAAPTKTLGVLLVERGYLSDSQLKALLGDQQANFAKAQAAPDPATSDDASFGKLLISQRLVTPEQLNEGLRAQASDPAHPRLGEALVAKGYLQPDQVTKVLAAQKKIIVECPGCRTAFNIAGAEAGQRVKCRACGKLMTVRTTAGGRLDVVETVVVPPKEPGKKFGRFDLFGELGRGSMAVVYKGRDSKTGRAVALKVLARESKVTEVDIERFRREAEAAAALKHPHIVAALEFGREGDQYWIAMDLVSGRSLEEMLQKGPLPALKAAAIARDVARALEHAHQNGIVHRDVKPGNILVDSAGKAYLADFGLARTLNKRALRLSGAGSAVGTPLYMSPEQALGETKRVDATSDVWSLGAVFHEMLTGHAPFSGESVQQILDAVVRKKPRPLPRALPRDFQVLVALCLQKEKDLRMGSAGALADQLDRVLAGKRGNASLPGGMKKLVVALRRNVLAASIAAGAVVIITVILAVLVNEKGKDAQAETDKKQAAVDEIAKTRAEADAVRGAAAVSYQAHLKKTHDLIAARKFKEAKNELDETLKNGPETAETGMCWAEVAFGTNDRRGAHERVEAILASNPKSAEAHYLAARIWLTSRNPDNAKDHLDRAIANRKGYVEALLARARFLDERGEAKASKADAEEALKVAPDDPWARLYRAKGKRIAGDVKGAREDVDFFLKAFPDEAAGYVERGLQAAANVDMLAALADLQLAIDKDPGSRVALLELARLRAAMGDYTQAEKDFSNCVALDPDDPAAYVDRGELYRILLQPQKARMDFGDALDKRKKYAPALVGLGRIAEATGDLKEAEARYTEAVQADPTYAPACYHRGRVYARLGNDRAALADLVHASANSESVREVFALTGVVYGGRFPLEMLEHELNSPFQTAIRKEDQLPPVKAWTYMLAGDWDKALAELNAAIGAGAPDPLVLMGRGMVHLERKEYVDAIHDLTDATDRKPDLATAQLFLARAYLLKGADAQAELALKRAREVRPRSPLVLDTLGLLLVAQRKVKEAQAAFAGVVYADPLWAEPRTLHGALLWLEQGVYSEKGQGEAIYDFEEAIATEWRSPEALVARGALRLNSGRAQDALVDAEAAMKLRPDDPIFMFLYGQALVENKRQEGYMILLKADAAFQQGHAKTFLGIFLEPLANVARGEARLMMGQLDEAERAFSDAQQGYFAESEAQFGLAKVQLARKNYDKAWEYLKRSKFSSSELVGKRDWDAVVKQLEQESGKSAAQMLK